MRIAQLSWLLSPRGGGIPPVLFALADAQRHAGHDVRVLGVRDPAWRLAESGASDHPALGPLAFGFAPRLAAQVLLGSYDIAHLHGLFTFPSQVAQAARWLRRGRLVVAPHGMLEPWALAHSAWKKRLFLALTEDANLRRAACIHVLCAAEAANVRNLGIRTPVAIVPNGIRLEEVPAHRDRAGLDRLFPETAGRRIVLFLGRVHPKKGIPHLLEAWQRLARDGVQRAEEWVLVIAGPDQLGHTTELRGLARELGVERDVLFVGSLHGEDKRAALAAADLFVLPSFSEGFSIAVLEAIAARIPVFVTRQCNFDVEAFGAGIVGEPDAESTYRGLRKLIELSDGERRAWGERGRREVETRYQWPAIARRMLSVYEWTLGGGPTPADIEVPR